MLFENNGNNGMYMPVAPAYGGGYGGMGLDGGGWWLFLFAAMMMCGGWGMGGFGGGMWPMMMGMNGGWGMGYDFPWLLNGQNQINTNTNAGFDHAATQAALGNLQTGMTAGFGDVQLGIAGLGRDICQTGNGITAAVNNGFSQAEIAANGRQMANMQQLFGIQSTQLQNGCETRASVADLKYAVAAEASATRAAGTADTQKILDKLCQLELDGVKQNYETRVLALQDQLAAARGENQSLRFERSQTAQTAAFNAGLTREVDAVYNRLKDCPVGTVPVAGSTPLFSCNPSFNGNNGGCGCGNAFGFSAA